MLQFFTVHCKMGISRSATVVISFMMKEYTMDLAQTLIHVQERRSIVNPNKGFIKQLEVYEGMLSAIRLRLTYYGRISHRSKSESSLVQSSNSDQLSNEAESSYNASRIAPEDLFTSVNVKAMSLAFSNAFSSSEKRNINISKDDLSQLRHICPLPESCTRTNRPKSWSPKDALANLLLSGEPNLDTVHDCEGLNINISHNMNPSTTIVSEGENIQSFMANRILNSDNDQLTEHESSEECTCFNDLAQNVSNGYSEVINENTHIESTEIKKDLNENMNSFNCVKDFASRFDNSDSNSELQTPSSTPNTYQRLTVSPNNALPNPVNSSNNAYNPNCDCNVEVELNVPEEPVKIHDTHTDLETDRIVQTLGNVPLQIRSSPLLEKINLARSDQQDNTNLNAKNKEQCLSRPNSSFSHQPINSGISNLMSHYFPAPYSPMPSNCNAKNVQEGKNTFNTSITSSTSSLASLSTASSPATPTSFNSPSGGVFRRKSDAGDFSFCGSVILPKRSMKKENRPTAGDKFLRKASVQSIMSISTPNSLIAKSNEQVKLHALDCATSCGGVEDLGSNVFKYDMNSSSRAQNELIHAEIHLNSGIIGDSGNDENLQINQNFGCHTLIEDGTSAAKAIHNDELSVKTLATLFDFKKGVTTSSIPTCKPISRLEDNKLFLKGKLNLEPMTTTKSIPNSKVNNESEC